MRFWNGYKVETLQKRGWAVVRIARTSIMSEQWKPMLECLEQDHPGRYFVASVPFDGEVIRRDYYFEDHKTATQFALRFS
jgi:hypothetical protein